LRRAARALRHARSACPPRLIQTGTKNIYRTFTACYIGYAMSEKPADDPVLTRFRAAVTEIYGERV
jgi:mannitol-1-phosphate/altronate dehydrogenase